MNNIPPIKEELDFRDLLKNPIRLFGYSYFYFLIVILLVGVYYVQSLDQISRNALQPRYVDTVLVEADLPMRAPANIPPVDIKKISIPAPVLLKQGKELYSANCASCHGDGGLGDGAAGLVMNPKPRNFTHSAEWVNGRKISEIYKTLDEGILENGMPSYNHLTAEDRFAMIHFVRTFANDFPQDSEDELKQLDATYKLAEGSRQSAQIPVKIASRKLVKESQMKSVKARKILEIWKSQLFDDEATVFNRVCNDRVRTAAILASNDVLVLKKDDFIKTITASPFDCGFDPKVIQLSRGEWDALHQYCVKTLQRIKP